jgi:ABC-2 type transport system ATP-binding protein
MMSDSKILIHAQDLVKHFGRFSAVRGISLQVAAGEIYGLVGPDGAGKTTTIRLLCGAMLPTNGEVHIGKFVQSQHPEHGRALIGYLPQRFSLYEELTVLENLRFFAEVRGLAERDWRPRCSEILAFIGLADYEGRRAGQLSGGMKQKLGLAVALVHRPAILLLDEPTTGVDPVTRQDFWQLLIRLAESERVAVLISTPYMDEAARCHRLGFILGGQLLLEGTPAALRERLAGRIIELRGHPLSLLRATALSDPAVEDAQMFGDRLHLRVQDDTAPAVIAHLIKAIPDAGGDLKWAGLIPPQLEDVFMSLLEKPQ